MAKRTKRRAQQLDVRRLRLASADAARKIKAAIGGPAAALAAAPAAEVMAPAPLKETAPGKERWSIKVGMDAGAANVGGQGGNQVVETTIEELVEAVRPKDMRPPTKNFKKYASRRVRPVEITIWRIECDIIGLKLEDDGDMHIVLRGASARTMVAEAPTARPPFVDDDSPWLDAMAEVRRRLNEHFGDHVVPMAMPPPGAEPRMMPAEAMAPEARAVLAPQPQRLGELLDAGTPFATKVDVTPVRVTGVGFFDRVHGQTGVAKNGIELHPILEIEFL